MFKSLSHQVAFLLCWYWGTLVHLTWSVGDEDVQNVVLMCRKVHHLLSTQNVSKSGIMSMTDLLMVIVPVDIWQVEIVSKWLSSCRYSQ